MCRSMLVDERGGKGKGKVALPWQHVSNCRAEHQCLDHVSLI